MILFFSVSVLKYFDKFCQVSLRGGHPNICTSGVSFLLILGSPYRFGTIDHFSCGMRVFHVSLSSGLEYNVFSRYIVVFSVVSVKWWLYSCLLFGEIGDFIENIFL